MKKILFLSAALLTLMASVTPQTLHADHSTAGMPESHAPQSTEPISGKVLEAMNNGGYSYIHLQKNNGDKIWLAVMEMKVGVGSVMNFRPGMEMANFESKGLKRTFESIIFTDVLTTKHGTDTTPELKKGKAMPPGSNGAKTAREGEVSVAKATGANAITVAEAFNNRAKLNKKKIVVRGKVVKVSTGIMKRNWVHIQDGTGSRNKGSHELVCTSQDTAEVGDVITVSGTLAKDRDFGSGYRYNSIIENARFKK